MSVLSAHDGTQLAYHVLGEGAAVICLPGGPMQDSTYLGDLGGLSGHLQLILFDYRGTGQSETPTDTSTYRCDHLVDDVEALREHLGLDRIDLLAHSAGANVAALYAVRYPERIGKLVLITPSTRAVGITAASEMRREVVRLREGEPWFVPASTAFEAIQAGQATDADWEAITPLTYGRWDAAARAHHASGDEQRNEEAAAVFGAEGAFDPTVNPRGPGNVRRAGAATCRGSRRGSPAERGGEVGRIVPERHARHPAGRRPLPLARRLRLVHHDRCSIPTVTTASRGAYTGKPRPVVIVQDDRFDATASITVCPMTTNAVEAPPVRTFTRGGGSGRHGGGDDE